MLYRVTDPGKIEHVLKLCKRASGTHPNASYIPFETPVSVDASTQFDPDSVVSLKADGTRYMLCLTMYDRKALACMVNRAEEVYCLRVQAPPKWFRDECVFDGEMCSYLPAPGEKLFLVFNALFVMGVSMFGRPYRSRLAEVSRHTSPTVLTAVERGRVIEMVVSATDRLHILAKPHMPAAELHRMIMLNGADDEISRTFASDGYIFTPLQDTMRTGRNPRILKWKREHTIDVLITCHLDRKELTLEALDQGVLVPLADVIMHTFEVDELLASVMRGAAVLHRLEGRRLSVFRDVVELSIHIPCTGVEMELRFVRVRSDKTNRGDGLPGANDVVTIRRTLDSVHSGITMDQLASMFRPPEQN